MRIKYINFITIVCLIAIIFVQIVWLYNSYIFLKRESVATISQALEQAVMEETFSRMQRLPVGTKVKSRTEKDKGRDIPEFAYMQESLNSLNMPLSLDSINRIYSKILEEKNFPSECTLLIFSGKQLIQHLGKMKESIFSLKTRQIPLRKDYSFTIQAEITNPNILFVEKMGTLLLATTVLIIFVIGGFVYQVRIIEQLNRLFHVREDFSYAMVHDMKTPLATIFTALNFLHSGRLDGKPEAKEKFFNVAKEEADRLLTLTNKLLTISKLENRKMKMDCRKVMLEPMLVRLAEKFKIKSDKSVSFEFDLQTSEVYADAEYIEEIFSNMIDNSIKYSKEHVDIRISSSSNDIYSIIKVYDNGFGIPEKDQSIIFDKYERAAASDRNHRRRISGFGLGLSFVQQVVEAHKGKIFINSIEGEFTEFIIYLPLMIKGI